MSDYIHYTGFEPLFGLGFPMEGELGTPADEGTRTRQIARVLGAMLGALGPGIYSGMVGSIVGGDVSLTAGAAVVSDELGAVPIAAGIEVITASQCAEGDQNFVHVQADETARTDGACGYVVLSTATPPAGGLLVCQVTVTDGVITAVDNAVRVAPAISDRLPWAAKIVETLAAVIGLPYTNPLTLDARLALVESGTGGGATGDWFWDGKARSQGDNTQIPQFVQKAIEDALAGLPAGGTGGTAGTTAAAPWDVDGANQSLALLTEIDQDNAAAGDTQRDSALVVPGVREGAVDFPHSTWTTGLTVPA